MSDQRKGLGFFDCLAIICIWGVLGGIIYLTQDAFIALCCLFPGYYLSKWAITKTND